MKSVVIHKFGTWNKLTPTIVKRNYAFETEHIVIQYVQMSQKCEISMTCFIYMFCSPHDIM